MITNFKFFEHKDFDEIKIYLIDIYCQSPWFFTLNVKKDYIFIINKLKEMFLNKYVNFEHYFFSSGVHTTKLLHGVIIDILYDNQYGSRITYFKLRGDNSFYSVKENSQITIDLMRSEIEKYNL